MKPTFIASLVAAALALPASAAPSALLDDLLAGALPMYEDYREDARGHGEAMRRWAEDFSHEMRSSLMTMYGPRMSSSRVVKNAPYSAEVVTEINQMLADGNVISKKTTGAVYRDAAGRTRQESAGEGKKGATVFINDPVDGKHIVLMPASKKAVVSTRAAALPVAVAVSEGKTRTKQVFRMGDKEIRIEDGKVFVDGKEVPGGNYELRHGGRDMRIENGRVTLDGKDLSNRHGSFIVRNIEEKQSSDGTRREEVRVQVIRSGDKEITIPVPPMPPVPPVPSVPPMSLLPPMPGVQTLRFESTARLGKGTTTQLGTKDIEGVRAEGQSTVWTIPAGEIGNRSPIQITSESWYSPELQVTLYSRYHDPRTGESIYRLAGLKRAEPSQELFAVPEGYDTKGRGTKRDERK